MIPIFRSTEKEQYIGFPSNIGKTELVIYDSVSKRYEIYTGQNAKPFWRISSPIIDYNAPWSIKILSFSSKNMALFMDFKNRKGYMPDLAVRDVYSPYLFRNREYNMLTRDRLWLTEKEIWQKKATDLIKQDLSVNSELILLWDETTPTISRLELLMD